MSDPNGADNSAPAVAVTYDPAIAQIADATNFNLRQIDLNYNQARDQAKDWSRFSMIAAVAGLVLVGAGVVALIFGQLTPGLITTLSGGVTTAVAKLFFDQSKAANKRVDDIQKQLNAAQWIQEAVRIARTIGDPQQRDKYNADILKRALSLTKEGAL